MIHLSVVSCPLSVVPATDNRRSNQLTVHRSSPPTFSARALRSLMTPFDVLTTQIPIPLSTLGRSFTLLYTRQPGLERRSIVWITFVPSVAYLSLIRSTP